MAAPQEIDPTQLLNRSLCQALLQTWRKEIESVAMINRETGLPSNPVVETAFRAIADWVSNYRHAFGFSKKHPALSDFGSRPALEAPTVQFKR
jgi:hypothetical protein